MKEDLSKIEIDLDTFEVNVNEEDMKTDFVKDLALYMKDAYKEMDIKGKEFDEKVESLGSLEVVNYNDIEELENRIPIIPCHPIFASS